MGDFHYATILFWTTCTSWTHLRSALNVLKSLFHESMHWVLFHFMTNITSNLFRNFEVCLAISEQFFTGSTAFE
jgi:hypothetical protein